MNLPYLRMELLRMLRNRKVLVLSVIMPAILLLIFGGMSRGQRLAGVDGAAFVMVGMALFGSMSAAVNNGGTIAVERGLGWNRQLRLTPLRPGWYATSKVIVSLVMALPPLLVSYLVGALVLGVRLRPAVWAGVLAGSWLAALPFAALGLVVGYLARPDGVQAVSGLLYLLLAGLGGLWVPVENMPAAVRDLAALTPAYWAGEVARAPLHPGGLSVGAVLAVAAWTLGLAAIGVLRCRADTTLA